MFFYTNRQGYAPANATNLSGASLTGYRINSTLGGASYNQLERYSAPPPNGTVATRAASSS